ncbi:MAG: phosphomannomutase [Maribacter sp.]
MTLIKSISGIRGTIGGFAGNNFTPQDIVECTAAFGFWVLGETANPKIVIGRDARISGEIVSNLVSSTLRSLGIDVIDLGLSTTPTVEIAVPAEGAGAGIIITASHNPKQWNALKFVNFNGEFISHQDGQDVLALIDANAVEYAPVEKLGSYTYIDDYIDRHIELILALPLVKVDIVKAKGYKVVIDPVNSTGALALPPLLEKLGCEVVILNGEPNGIFAHNPEPLPQNLTELSSAVLSNGAHLGISVDPDVDRLALVCEDGEMFGEEYTLVAVADYVLQHKKGATVSNLSSTSALKIVTEKAGCEYHPSAVGEVNVVQKMKEVMAVIGGEGNGGIIYPDLHFGRDALVGVALILSQLAEFGKPLSFMKSRYPSYHIAKNKIELTPDIDLDMLFAQLNKKYASQELNTIDGLKITLEGGDWIHLRRSNTEPIVRIYTESTSPVIAQNLARKIQMDINDILKEHNV